MALPSARTRCPCRTSGTDRRWRLAEMRHSRAVAPRNPRPARQAGQESLNLASSVSLASFASFQSWRINLQRTHPMWTIFGAIALVLGILFWAQRSFIYFPAGQVSSPASAGLPNAASVHFRTEDDLDLEAWFVPARERSE